MPASIAVLLTAKDVAKILRLHVKTVVRQAREGRLPGFQVIGSEWRFREADLESWMTAQVRSSGQPVSER